jgi:hypothetical protein
MRNVRGYLGPLVFFLILPVAVFAPITVSGRVLGSGDALNQGIPAFYSARGLWTPLVFSGYPAIADPQNMTFYPPAALFRSFPNSYNAFVLAGYVLAGFFMYAFALKLTRSWKAALLSGTSYSLSGFLASHLTHVNMIHAAAWPPLVFLLTERLRERPGARRLAALSLAISCAFFAGHPQIFVFSLALALTYTGIIAFRPIPGRGSFLGAIALAYLLAGGLTAILSLPMVELARNSVRAEMSFQESVGDAIPPPELRTIIDPFTDREATNFNAGEWTGYIGIGTMLLALVAMVRREKHAGFFIAAALCSLILAVGPFTPVAKTLFAVPIYNWFREPARHLFEFTFCTSVLAGLGLASLERTGPKNWRLSMTAAIFVSTLAALCSIRPAGRVVDVITVLIPAIATAAAFLAYSKVPAAYPLLLLVLAADLGYLALHINRPRSPAISEISEPPSLEAYAGRIKTSRQRLAPLEGIDQPREAAPPNRSALWNISSVGGYNPLLIRDYARLLGMRIGGELSAEALDSENRGLDVLSLRYLLVPKSLIEGKTNFSRSGVGWRGPELYVELGSGCGVSHRDTFEASVTDFAADSIAIVSSLSCSTSVRDGETVAKIRALSTDGTDEDLSLKAGNDTSEWAFDRPDVRQIAAHGKARVFDSFLSVDDRGKTFDGHHYLSVLRFSAVLPIQKVRLQWSGSAGTLSLSKVSLFNSRTQQSYGLAGELEYIPGARWKPAGDMPETTVFENMSAMPRAWLVQNTVRLTESETMRTLQTSRLPSGQRFDPRRSAIVNETLPDFAGSSTAEIGGDVSIAAMSNSAMTIHTAAPRDSLLVVSDVYYPGWSASIDGHPAPIYRTDLVLRGVIVPAGAHDVVFKFRPETFFVGLVVSVLSVIGLAAGVAVAK